MAATRELPLPDQEPGDDARAPAHRASTDVEAAGEEALPAEPERPSLRKALYTALESFAVTRVLMVLIGAGALGVREPILGTSFFSVKVWSLLGESFSMWDGQWFIAAATRGYGPQTIDSAGQSTSPFFPLLPGATAALHALGIPTTAAALVVTNAAFVTALFFIYQLAFDRGGESLGRRATWMAAIVPFGIAFSMVYADGLFLAASAGAFLAIYRRRWWLVPVAAVVAVLARPNGLVLAAALAYVIWIESDTIRERLERLAPLALAPAAVAAWVFALGRLTGDPFAFASSKAAWRELPVWELIPATYNLFTGGRSGDPLPGGAVPHLAMAALGIVALVAGRRALAKGWGVYSVLIIGVPLVTGVVGLGRYTASLFPVYIAGAAAVPEGGRLERWLVFGAGMAMVVTVTGIFWSRLVP